MTEKVLWKVLCAVSAVLVLLAIAAGVTFGSDAPRRVTVTAAGEYVRFSGWGKFERNPFTGKLEMVPLYMLTDIDVVIHGDVTLYGTTYHEGDRLTSDDGKLVKQSLYQVARNDLRFWAYRAWKKMGGRD